MTQKLAAAGGDKVRLSPSRRTSKAARSSRVSSPTAPQRPWFTAASSLFSGAAGLGRKLAGITIISDGRQTREDAAGELVLRAQAAGVPIHVVPLGTDWGGKDLILHATRRLVMALPEQTSEHRRDD